MKQLWALIGRLSYIAAWPALYFYLKNSQRTRVVVKAEGKVLMVKDWLGDSSWKLPGGGIHKNETQLNSAVRELYEETGIKVVSGQLRPKGSIKSHGHGTEVVLHIFSLDLPKIVPVKKQKLEIMDIGWQDPWELSRQGLISTNTRAVLAKTDGFELGS